MLTALSVRLNVVSYDICNVQNRRVQVSSHVDCSVAMVTVSDDAGRQIHRYLARDCFQLPQPDGASSLQ